MTLVVSDTSPLNLLVRIGCEGVLPSLFNRVVIPPEVVHEMMHPKAPAEVRTFIVSPPSWLTIQTPIDMIPLPHGRVRALNFHVSDAILQASLARHLAFAANQKSSP